MSYFAFVPTKDQIEGSNIHRFMRKYGIASLEDLQKKSISDSGWYWDAVSEDVGIIWDKKYRTVFDARDGKPFTKWFVDGKTNIISSTVTKFAKKCPEKIAYHFVSEDGCEKSITYSELEIQTNKLANALKKIGVEKGDVVAIYMPMMLEAILAILACAKIGAIQTVVFSGYSTDSLHVRLEDCNAKVLFTSDGFIRKGKNVSQKAIVNEAIRNTSVKYVIVVPYKNVDKYEYSQQTLNYVELVRNEPPSCRTEIMDSEDTLFILYTSGTTGRPKGVIHTHGAFSVYAGHQAAYLIDLNESDILFWPADIGWITGQTWNVYGLLIVGATAVLYDGAIDWPTPYKLFEIIQKYKVTVFGTSPTAVRMFRKYGVQPSKFKTETIKNIPTTGEPIDEDSWWWLYEKIGKKKIPIMNLAGGTEIGGAMLSVLPGMRLKPTTVGMPCPGFNLDVIDEKGKSVRGAKGFLVVKTPWPTMTRGLLNDNQRYLATYWSQYDGLWFHGDYVLVDEDGLWYMYGRVDDVINVSGHRLSTVEIEECVTGYRKVSDAAVISIPDEITGEAVVVFVVSKSPPDTHIQSEVSDVIVNMIGRIARPKLVLPLSDLPKTRTGKVMRRLLKAKLLGLPLGDISPLENPEVLDEIPTLSA